MAEFAVSGADPVDAGFQYLEDLATAYWYSEVLFAALELKLFDDLQGGKGDLDSLSDARACRPASLSRLLEVLGALELIGESDGIWYNHPVATRYLVTESPSYLGDFLLYRRYIQTNWMHLGGRLRGNDGRSLPPSAAGPVDRQEDYSRRNFYYVRAMDALAREKAEEISKILEKETWSSPILDVGGGAGALSRALIRIKPQAEAYLFELPEVHQAARIRYPDQRQWERIIPLKGDFRHFRFSPDQKFGLILMSNFLHAYGPVEARRLLEKACGRLLPEGLLVVHDYFPDMGHRFPHKGALYDLNMMLNTYNGGCHRAQEVVKWLSAAGMPRIIQQDLSSDSSLLIAAGSDVQLAAPPKDQWPLFAKEMGLRKAVMMRPDQVAVATWVPEKCRSGCALYGKKLQCPPHCLAPDETRKIMAEYTLALLVEGAPPGKLFHEKLLSLERRAFLDGYHKALVFGAGPCPVCDDACPSDNICRYPNKSRPSMEGAGIDVYTTARRAGLSIRPVQGRGDYVKYFGLLLLE